MDKVQGKWKIEGYDTFENEPYPLPGEYDGEDSAVDEAKKRLAELELSQPSETSGGQDYGGIQDKIYIVRPDGTKYLFR